MNLVIDKTTDGKEFTESFLAHYASPYYDPVKAHAYYLRTRELKGRRKKEQEAAAKKAAKSALTSKAQRSIYAVSLDSIAKEKQAEADKLTTDTQTAMDGLSAKAEQSLNNINAALDTLIKQFNRSTNERPLNRIPPNATPQMRAFLERQNRDIIARKNRDAAQKGSLALRQASRDRNNIVRQLSMAISDARTKYESAMRTLDVKYDKIAEDEKQRIHDQVPGAPKKK